MERPTHVSLIDTDCKKLRLVDLVEGPGTWVAMGRESQLIWFLAYEYWLLSQSIRSDQTRPDQICFWRFESDWWKGLPE